MGRERSGNPLAARPDHDHGGMSTLRELANTTDRFWDGRRWEITGIGETEYELTAVDNGEIIVRSKQWVRLWTAPVLS